MTLVKDINGIDLETLCIKKQKLYISYKRNDTLKTFLGTTNLFDSHFIVSLFRTLETFSDKS